MLSQSLYFSRPPPPRAIIPDARPLDTNGRHRRAISQRSHRKIGDCEQSILNISLVLLRICLFSATLLAVNTKKRS